jgi:cytochrome c oxidase subunit 2
VVDTRHEYAGLEGIYLPIAIAVFAIVTLLVAYAIVRGRIRRRREEIGSQRPEHNPLEIAVGVVLVLIIAFLVYQTFSTEDRTDAIAASPGLEIKASAGQWDWRFSYPAYGITAQQSPSSKAVLVVPTGTVVHFTATSQDVIHAFYVPGRRFKRDLFPGRNSSFDLAWTQPGRFRGECAEFCGYLHSHMDFVVEAMPPARFRAWANAHRGGAQ